MDKVYALFEQTDSKGTLVGVFSSQELVNRAIAHDGDRTKYVVQEIMLNQIMIYDA